MLGVVRQLETCFPVPYRRSYLSFSLSLHLIHSCVFFLLSPVFVLGLIHFHVSPSSSSTVVSVLSANLSEPLWRRPLPGLNSKENRMFPKLGRPMKSESEDGEPEEKHGKYKPETEKPEKRQRR